MRKGALDLEVSCDIDALRVTPEQAARVLGLLPNLEHHICVNDSNGDRFGDELVGTELPHLLEHVIIELQGAAQDDNDLALTGHTSWLDELAVTEPEGFALMRTSVTFADDFVALGAMNAALEIIGWVCDPDALSMPDIGAILRSLAAQ